MISSEIQLALLLRMNKLVEFVTPSQSHRNLPGDGRAQIVNRCIVCYVDDNLRHPLNSARKGMARFSYLSTPCLLSVAVLLVVSIDTWAVGDGSAPWVGMSHAGFACSGSNVGNFGPYDYVTRKDVLRVVENAHFTPRVQNLQGGENAAGPTSDLDYVLKVIPNHHLALNSAMQFHVLQLGKYQQLSQKRKQTGYRLKSPVECYLQRAINYSPGDATSRMLYAVFLQREGQLKQSAQQYEKALELAPTAQNIEYNYALVLVELKRYEPAREIAKRLYGDNFPLPGLKKRLQAAKEW